MQHKYITPPQKCTAGHRSVIFCYYTSCSAQQDTERLWSVLELLTAANPRARDYLGHKSRAALALRDYDAALRASAQLAELLVSEQDASASPARQQYVEGHLKKVGAPYRHNLTPPWLHFR